MQPKALDEAERILGAADARGVTLRLLGGTAILLRCPSAHASPLVRTRAPDLDFAGLKKENTRIKDVFAAAGYRPNEHFNALHGYKQLMFYGPDGEPKVDVFLDRFTMCHELDLRPRLPLSRKTLPLADLLLTKLQIVQINEKDLKDLIALFVDHDVGEGEHEDVIDGRFVTRLASEDWGLYTTLTDNLDKVRKYLDGIAMSPADGERTVARLERMRRMIEDEPKSLGWRLRAKVGRRLAWYNLPDEPTPIILGQGPSK